MYDDPLFLQYLRLW